MARCDHDNEGGTGLFLVALVIGAIYILSQPSSTTTATAAPTTTTTVTAPTHTHPTTTRPSLSGDYGGGRVVGGGVTATVETEDGLRQNLEQLADCMTSDGILTGPIFCIGKAAGE